MSEAAIKCAVRGLMLNIKKKNIISLFWGVACVSCFVSFLVFGERLALCVNNSLILCAKRLIPSLFPLMIASRLLLSSGVGGFIGKILKKPCRCLLGLSAGGSFAFIIGIVCGFPLGAVCANSLYEKRVISFDELSFLIVASSIPSFGFVVGVIGMGVFQNSRMGIILYLCAILSAIITGMIYRFTVFRGRVFYDGGFVITESGGIIGKFCDAIFLSVKNMLSVCGFIVFFSLVCEVLLSILSFFCAPEIFKILICGIMELSRGALAASELPWDLAFVLCGGFIGWSGLCVLSQIMSACRSARIDIRHLLGFKVVFSLICSFLAFLMSMIL